MGAPARKPRKSGEPVAFANSWALIGLLLGISLVLFLGLAFWGTVPFFVQVLVSTAATVSLLLGSFWTYQNHRQLSKEFHEQGRYATRLRKLLDLAGDGIVTYDENGKIRSFNQAAVRIFGYEPHEVIGTSIAKLIPGESITGTLLGTGKATILDKTDLVEGRRKDGTLLPLQPSLSKVPYGRGRRLIMVLRDLTKLKQAEEKLRQAHDELEVRVRQRTLELQGANAQLLETNRVLVKEIDSRKEAEESLRVSEERYRGLVRLAPDAILIQRDDRIEFVNTSALRLFGVASLEQAEGLTLSDLIVPDSQPRMRDCLRTVLEARRQASHLELQIQRRDGRVVEVEAAAAAFKDQGQTVVQIVLRDISARKRAEAQLQESERRQRALARKLLEAQETERRHLAHELHDETGQTLTAIKITLQAAKRVADATTNQLLDECIQLSEKTLTQVRHLSVDLRPAALDKLGLVPSLRGLLDRQAQRANLVTHLDAEVSSPRFPADLETTCYRIVQEAVTNVIRHAQAKEVWVRLREHPRELLLSVQDNGIGFDVTRAREQGIRGVSMGLLGVQERVQLVGGRFEIQSTPGHGTELRARIPLTEPEDQERRVADHGAHSRTAG